VNKLRISLTEKEEGEIKGKIEADGDSLFVFECLLEIIETLAKARGLDARELVRDLYGRLK
jgi:hypothetical protein